jgi:hypothetical protein
MNARIGKLCRFTGIVVIVGSILLVPWRGWQLRKLESQPGYYDPTGGERETLGTYLYILIGVAIGCVFLWVASRSSQKKESDKGS